MNHTTTPQHDLHALAIINGEEPISSRPTASLWWGFNGRPHVCATLNTDEMPIRVARELRDALTFLINVAASIPGSDHAGDVDHTDDMGEWAPGRHIVDPVVTA